MEFNGGADGGLQDEWSKITMEEVRAHISDMYRQCKLPVEGLSSQHSGNVE